MILNLAFSVLLAWLAYVAFAPAFSEWVQSHLALWAHPYSSQIFAVILTALVVGCNLPRGRLGPKMRSPLWTTGPGRWLIGRMAGGAVRLGIGLSVFAAAHAGGLPDGVCLAAAVVGAIFAARQAKIAIGKGTRPLRRFLRFRAVGLGGSAAFAGILEEWSHLWKAGQIMLGASLYDRNWYVGVSDDRHGLTVATARAGKGLTAIIPNLLLWRGSSLVIDIKGQNMAVTAEARKKLGQKVYYLDPFGKTTDRLNPLSGLDKKAKDYVERVVRIADAIVVQSQEKNGSFFSNSARDLIAGAIDYVTRSENVDPKDRHLGTVRKLLVDGLPLKDLIAIEGLAKAAAAQLGQGGKNSGGDIRSTALMNTAWLESASMQYVLSESTFSLTDLNDGDTTVYLVLPPEYQNAHTRFLRLFVAMALQACMEGRKGKHATLFLLDEFYALGPLTDLSSASATLPGYGVKLWPIVHNFSQIMEHYPKNWETFVGNAGTLQAFATNDKTTGDYLSAKLGAQILWRCVDGPDGPEWEPVRTANVRDVGEIGRTAGRESKCSIVFREGNDPFYLKRVPYTKMFRGSQYDSDPFEKGRSGILSDLKGLTWAYAKKLLRGLALRLARHLK